MYMSNICNERNECEAPSMLKALRLQNMSDFPRGTHHRKHASEFRSQGSLDLSHLSIGKGSSVLPPVIKNEELSNDYNEISECKARFLSKDLLAQQGRKSTIHLSKCASESKSQSSPDIAPVSKVEQLSNVCNKNNGYATEFRSRSSPRLTSVAKVEKSSNVCNESNGYAPDTRSESSPDLTPVAKVEELSNICNESNGCEVPSSLKTLLLQDFPSTTHHSQCEPEIRCRSSTDLPLESRVEEGDYPCIYVCNLCKGYFYSEYQVAQHTCQHGNDSPAAEESSSTKSPREGLHKRRERKRLECIFCSKIFPYLYLLKKHMRVHTGEKPFECDTYKHLPKPMEEHSEDGGQRFACPKCSKAFSAVAELKIHLRKDHDVYRQYGCDSCQSIFLSSSQLKKHYLTCAPKEWFSCDLCKAKFTRRHTLKAHLHKHNKKFECAFCSKAFSSESSLREHLPKHTGDQPFECDLCHKKFSYKNSLRVHKLTHEVSSNEPCDRPGEGGTTGESPLHGCPKCDENFSLMSDLKSHLLAKHNIRRCFKCSSCQLVFVSGIHMREHYRTCAREDLFSCHLCDSKFSSQGSLHSHLRSHEDEKRFGCPFCEMKFNHKYMMKIHMRVHTGEKPYACDICSRKFNHKNSLTAHTRTHADDSIEGNPSGLSLHECPKCGDKSFTMPRLKRHLREDHDVKLIFSCTPCESVFLSAVALRKHRLDCAPKSWFQCDLCDARFGLKNSLLCHVAKQHKAKDRFACGSCDMKFSYEYLLVKHVRQHTG